MGDVFLTGSPNGDHCYFLQILIARAWVGVMLNTVHAQSVCNWHLQLGSFNKRCFCDYCLICRLLHMHPLMPRAIGEAARTTSTFHPIILWSQAHKSYLLCAFLRCCCGMWSTCTPRAAPVKF